MVFLTVTLLLTLLSTLQSAPTKDGSLEIIILHNNDMHARFEQTGAFGNDCQPKDVANNNCYGGFARVAHKIREYRKQETEGGLPVLYLNAGDTYTGTPWFSLFKDNITASFLNILKPDAISLGNHEFDEGVSGLAPFLKEIDFPVLAANLDFSETPELQSINSLKNSIVFEKNGVKIGVIGYLTPETKQLAAPNTVLFNDEIDAINKEAAILKSQGIKILIALGHSGLERDKVIAASCPEIDLVIGGHSHTFLYSGALPDIDKPEGPYPVLVKNSNGKEILVVQAYAYTKYLGYLRLQFDAEGNLIKHDGSPILLNGAVDRDSDVLQLLELYRPGIIEMETTIIGETKVFLDASRCRFEECNIGNLIADSRQHTYAITYLQNYWTDAAIVFVQSGGVRTSIEIGDDGSISKKDLLNVMPFGNAVVVVDVTGDIILQMLERSVERYDGKTGYGEFLQMSGVHVTYNLSDKPGKRVKHCEVLCAECKIPSYSQILKEKEYKIIVDQFVLKGGDGYSMLANQTYKVLELIDIEMTEEYLKKIKPVYPAIEWRITLEGSSSPNDPPTPFPITTTTPGAGSHIQYSTLTVASALIFNMLYRL